jgi:hypothetical protein
MNACTHLPRALVSLLIRPSTPLKKNQMLYNSSLQASIKDVCDVPIQRQNLHAQKHMKFNRSV